MSKTAAAIIAALRAEESRIRIEQDTISIMMAEWHFTLPGYGGKLTLCSGFGFSNVTARVDHSTFEMSWWQRWRAERLVRRIVARERDKADDISSRRLSLQVVGK